jgi:hypothetical protein
MELMTREAASLKFSRTDVAINFREIDKLVSRHNRDNDANPIANVDIKLVIIYSIRVALQQK